MTKIDHMMIIVEMDDGYLVVSYNIFSYFYMSSNIQIYFHNKNIMYDAY